MFNSTTLEVAIGMAFIYLLLSLLCSGINEAIAAVLGSRAKNLEAGIKSLFTEGNLKSAVTTAAGTEPAVSFLDAIYSHGLIQSLYKSGTGTADERQKANLPAYIPPATFATALLDLVFPSTPNAGLPNNLNDMLTKINALPDSKAKQALQSLVKQADGDIDKTRQAFEDWYNNGMQRAAGWYKRKTQLVLFCLGLALAAAINIDSIAVARALWTTPALRTYTINAAQQYAHDHPLPSKPDTSPQQTNSSVATTSTQPPPDYKTALQAQAELNDLQSFGLPVGWTEAVYKNTFCLPNLLIVLLGWFFTAIAMTLGAPFWFDLLNRFMNVRSTVKPGEKPKA